MSSDESLRNAITLPLPATDARDALVDWAKTEISSVSEVRFTAAKFYFGASAATMGFVVAAWREFHKGDPTYPIVCAVLMLGVSILASLVMFWPVVRVLDEIPNLQSEHARFLKRLQLEGHIWAVSWSAGVSLGLWSIVRQ